MNSASKYAVVALCVLPLCGCAGKKVQAVAPPPQAQAPPIDTGHAGALYPPPLTQEPAPPEQAAATPAAPVTQPAPTPEPEPAPDESKKAEVHKPKPAKPAGGTANGDNAAAPPPPATESEPLNAANGEPAASSPIGQLTTGDTAGRTQTRKDTVDLITNTENGLNAIKRPLNAEEQETANRIKNFLAKAKQALSNADLDGAYTLATKAKVLLDELTKP